MPLSSIPQITLATVAYIAFTFPWAITWHIVLFRSFYETTGYFSEAPNFALGLLSIALQGALLSIGAQYVRLRGGPLAQGLKYALVAGALLWTCHVLAAAAKQPLLADWRYFLLETPYLAVQFGVYGLAVGWISQRMGGPAAER